MRNQKGFATLEIILVMLIISALMGVVIPKTARVLDTAILDYEVKKFRSEFFLARSLSRSASCELSIFLNSPISKGHGITFKVAENNHRIESNGKLIREKNFFPSGFKIKWQGSDLGEISFNSFGRSGKSGTYTFTSPLNNKRYLMLDSVGRLHSSREN